MVALGRYAEPKEETLQKAGCQKLAAGAERSLTGVPRTHPLSGVPTCSLTATSGRLTLLSTLAGHPRAYKAQLPHLLPGQGEAQSAVSAVPVAVPHTAPGSWPRSRWRAGSACVPCS